MIGLLVFKERLKAFYGTYSFIVNPIRKFLLSMAALILLNQNLGFMELLKNPLLFTAVSLLSAFLPVSVLTCISAVFMMLHLYSVSFELTVITGILVLTVAILYSGFQPGNSIIMVITPMLFFIQVPFAVPLIVGLSCGLSALIPMCVGVFFYYLLIYAKQNAGVLAGSAAIDITQKYTQILDSLLSNELMILMVLTFAAAAIVVYLIKSLSVAYAWTIAIAAGVVVELAVIFFGNSRMDVNLSVSSIIIGVLLSLALALIFQFFVFAVDYSRTEFLQFQDDDYYYYVKAVPKMTVTAPDVKVQRINKRKDS
ncbi:MAG: ABC transporter permease [Lachnospiraceae bacterium]|jgi:hypothetical protein|nr:ABC transporter permease [Lachnospiraceae bacterium]